MKQIEKCKKSSLKSLVNTAKKMILQSKLWEVRKMKEMKREQNVRT